MASSSRYYFIDYLRGFIVALVVLDHALQAYAPHFGQFWFVPDIDRTLFFDIFHMHNNSFMMPILFFLSGLFVIPSLQRRGYLSFARERLIRLGLPFLIGLPLLAPLVSYVTHVAEEGLQAKSYPSFWVDAMTAHFIQAGIFWFLYYLMLLTVIFVSLYRFTPFFFQSLQRILGWGVENPLKGLIFLCLLSAVILGLSDLIWGAPWFIGWGRVFHVQGSRFILLGLYFVIGMGVGASNILERKEIWQRLSSQWHLWTLAMLGAGFLYITYTLTHLDDGVYNGAIRSFFKHGGHFDEALPIFLEWAPPVLIRTTLHGIFCILQTLCYLAVFYRFFNGENAVWQSLSVCSYGIYLIHEGFVVWLHYGMYGTEIPILIKFLISGGGSLLISWILVEKVLRPLPFLKRVL